MTPTSWLAVLLFLLLIAPGLLYDLLAQRRRVTASETAFREASRTVLASAGFAFVALLVFAVAHATHPGWVVDPAELLGQHGQTYLAAHYALLLTNVVVAAALALFLAWMLDRLLSRGRNPTITQRSTWLVAFRTDCPAGAYPLARVRLTSGVVWIGRVTNYTADIEHENRELVLGPPLSTQNTKPLPSPLGSNWERVVIRGADIESILVSYPREDAAT